MNDQSQDFDKGLADLEAQVERLRLLAKESGMLGEDEMAALEKKLSDLKARQRREPTAMDRVQLARHSKRPYTLDYLARSFTDFIELHGDRAFRDDQAVVGGWARINGRSVMVVGQQKGRAMKENLRRNFGMAHPEGYRKALRLMRMAEKFGRPVVTLIDTPGAYPGIGAEERGQAEAIARNLLEMARLRTPIVAVVIGEGGSGGALGIGVADRILMLSNAIYSVISPEGCAAILWKTAQARDKAAKALKLTAADLARLGVIDTLIAEPAGGAQNDWDLMADLVREAVARALDELVPVPIDDLRRQRWAKYEALGAYRDAETVT